MKILQITFILFTFFTSYPCIIYSQSNPEIELSFKVNRINAPISTSKAILNEAQTFYDFNRSYKPSWVKEYKSVEITTIHLGEKTTTIGSNEILTPKQKHQMLMADVATDISILVKYIPNNTLQHNDIKEIDFSFMVNPENEARFVGGEELLNQYLKQNAIDKIPNSCFTGLELAAVKFTIDEDGKVFNTRVFESSKDEDVDQLLITALNNMPDWEPAEYANGTKIKQDFVLTVGNMKSCVINLLNINQ